MPSKIVEGQTVEITLNLRRIAFSVPSTRKAPGAIRRLKKEIQKYFGEKIGVVVTKELNNFVFSNGKRNIPPKIRVRVTKKTCEKDAEKQILHTDLVIVGSFKGLKEIIID
ncbi:ribosomal protein L31 [Ordospora pajunii]|uniref:ribosomal protein L31 n=1 Tax=Ordospora pajunii TaxID=3039483 RepID=UPI0029526FE5|nr:ribosomal protein L31 [Ordospora pajunii]KAH9411835.1 ribosomal protein L31 [Ordospora pajunii]